jgi:hypothetical protein
MICFKEFEMNRQVEPAYLDPHGFILVPHGFILVPHGFILVPHGFILVPRIHYFIAMVRAYEMRAEAELKEEIRRVLYIMMPGDKDVAIVTVKYFEHFLAFHGNFKFAAMRVLAACAAHLGLFQTSKIPDQHVMLKEFNAPDLPDFGELVEIAVDKIYIWASCLMMLGLETNLSVRLGKSQREAIADGTDMAHRVWMNSAKGTQWSILAWIDWKRNLAICTEEGLRRYGVELSYDEILEMLGETPYPRADSWARNSMRRHFIGVKDWGYSN